MKQIRELREEVWKPEKWSCLGEWGVNGVQKCNRIVVLLPRSIRVYVSEPGSVVWLCSLGLFNCSGVGAEQAESWINQEKGFAR